MAVSALQPGQTFDLAERSRVDNGLPLINTAARLGAARHKWCWAETVLWCHAATGAGRISAKPVKPCFQTACRCGCGLPAGAWCHSRRVR